MPVIAIPAMNYCKRLRNQRFLSNKTFRINLFPQDFQLRPCPEIGPIFSSSMRFISAILCSLENVLVGAGLAAEVKS